MNYRGAGNKIRSLRIEKGWTQEQLAEKVGVSDKYISKIETGNRKPSIEFYIDVSNILGVSLDYLFYDAINVKKNIYADDPEADYFLIKELTPGFLDGISSTYKDPEGYLVCEKNPKGFEQFESTFPNKEKLKLPGQLF